MWCTWLDRQLPFNEQQEEEIVSALINSVTATHDIQAWSFGRLEQLLTCDVSTIEGRVILLRKSSWEKFYRLLSQEVGKFILPTTLGIVEYGINDDEDCTDENDDEDSGLLRFRFTALDAFYQQNASLDGAASTGLRFQKLLSCWIKFENSVTQSKVSSEGLPIEGLSENDSDIKRWFVDLVSSWKYFFHWICQDSEVLLNQPARDDAREKIGWWKLVARVYIGCAICNVAIELLMWRLPVGNSSKRDRVDRDLAAFDTDDGGISVWSLMEVEFSLQRMIQKLVSRYVNEAGTSLSKEYVKSTSHGLHRVLQPAMIRTLTAVGTTLQETLTSKSAKHERRNGMSFDAVLFALDSCSRSTLGDDDSCGALCPWDTKADDLEEASSILELLLRVYINTRNYIVPLSNDSGADGVRMRGEMEEKSVCRLPLSVYADSISAKFPVFARHLVAPGKSAKAVVLLDLKSGEEMLERVCAAIRRTLEVMTKSSSLHSVHDRLGQVLLKVSWNGLSEPTEIQEIGERNNFACLSGYFLGDIKNYVQLDGFAKTSVSCASLSKRLLDNTAEMVDPAVNCVDLYKLSSLAYDILCDNVVYNARLLRLLMNICLPTHLALHIKTFAMLESKIEAVIQTCGSNSAEDVDASTSKDCHQRRPALKKTKKSSGALARRKRLRQQTDVWSPYKLSVDSDTDVNAGYSSDSDLSYDTNAAADSRTDVIKYRQCTSSQTDRVPHLQSRATQRIVVVTVLAALEQSQSTLLQIVTAKHRDKEPFDHEELLGYIRIHEVVNTAISADIDFLCETRNVLLKVLHMIELGLRIGKAVGTLQRKGGDPEVKWHDSAICIYEFSVMSALRNRVWAGGIKDASEDSDIKTKISSTLLKMDIFFLQVPGIVQTWLKEMSIPGPTKERLKSLVMMVKDRIAPTSLSNIRRGKAKARQRLLSVVPIVRKRKKRLRSRHPVIDAFLNEEDGADAFADLEDFIE
uniref:Uncharacterized protein n=2 Tax=Hyaloperonospora arabidopsidis (strain Emoy2) TaxID=559515 RepID=M4B558_HYAAE